MFKASLLIPLPPGSTAEAATGAEKQAIGLYPCLGEDCGEYVLIKTDNKGRPYGTCSTKEITVCGCGREAKGQATDVPAQTLENYAQQFRTVTDIFPMKDTYKTYLQAAWDKYAKRSATSEHSTDASLSQ